MAIALDMTGAEVPADHCRRRIGETRKQRAAGFGGLPRIGIGVVGSGFVAEALPNEWIAPWLGPESGFLGVVIATLGGALTPGGPVIGFSIGAAALKSGAGAPQVIAYSTAWALYAIHRLIIWEVPLMPARVVWLRAAASLPLPFIAAALAMLLGRP